MPSVHAVVLQAPRGNIETINPRGLVLTSVRQSIEKKDFRAAFLTCRTHRIDLNILHNHKPDLFMTNISLFVKQLGDVEFIDLFLSSLKYIHCIWRWLMIGMMGLLLILRLLKFRLFVMLYWQSCWLSILRHISPGR